MEEKRELEKSTNLIVEERRWNRITLKYIFSSLLDAFNLERGGIYTLKRLFINPGQMAKDYLGAERFHFTPPFRLLFITTAIVIYIISELGFADAFLEDFTKGFESYEEGSKAEIAKRKIVEILVGWGKVANLILWTLIPILAMFSYFFNRKLKYNYAEHLVLQTYFFCLTNILSYFVVLMNVVNQLTIINLISILSIIYFIYFYMVAFSKSILKSIIDSILIYIFSSIIWTVMLIIILFVQLKMAI